MFIYLTDDEKLNSLLYMERFLSEDETMMSKQLEIIEVFLDNVVKECDYRYIG